MRGTLDDVAPAAPAADGVPASAASGTEVAQEQARLRRGLVGTLRPVAREPPAGVHFVSVGDVRLSELRTLLSKAGKHAEFHDGALVVNGGVRVRKEGGGAGSRLVVEGSYGPDYVQVREMLYGQLAAV